MTTRKVPGAGRHRGGRRREQRSAVKAASLADELVHLDDAGVYERLAAANRAISRDLLRDPVPLARGHASYRMRPHLKV